MRLDLADAVVDMTAPNSPHAARACASKTKSKPTNHYRRSASARICGASTYSQGSGPSMIISAGPFGSLISRRFVSLKYIPT